MQTRRAFQDRPANEQKWLRENTWCDVCQAANLGMNDPVEYEEDGEIILEGKCARCGHAVFCEIKD